MVAVCLLHYCSEMCNWRMFTYDDAGGSLSTNCMQLFSLCFGRFGLVKMICELDKIVFSKRRFVSHLVKTLARLPPAAFCTAICALPFWNFRFIHLITSDLDEFVEI
ncbi:putative 50S ribosomal protein L16 [Trichinella spiralis]|uniref:putative 50S ribosomal protein L16 n=1 Tax=Trichinella spiralis TaxID=6334 RepID=UPI0001EFC68A|nr:putative 50S ribosomal protein L16 [Trichinella spiralis]